MATFLRFARVIVGQAIGLALTIWGGWNIPYVNITLGAVVTALFKFLRDKYPNSPILEYLPL